MPLLPLLSAGTVAPVAPGKAWTLTVGGRDLTNYVHNGARFVEVASSIEGLCTFTLNGVHTEVVAGASILLSVNSQAAWEGTVSTATVQTDADGNPVGMMVLGAPLSAQLDTAVNYVFTQATDVSILAAALCAQTPVPFGSQTNIGTTGGTLSIKNAASGLSVAGLLTRKHWRVQNGAVSYVGPESMTALSQSLQGASVAASSVSVTGGLDATTKQPLQGTFTASQVGPAYHASHPELADHATLTAAGSALAERYSQAMTTTLTLPVQTNLRAGDWFVDSEGVTAHAHKVEYALTSGKFVPKVDFGFPALPVASADTQAARAAQHPASSVAHDFLVTGAAFSSLGLSVTIGATTFVLGGTQYTLNSGSLSLQPLETQLITATSSGFSVAKYAGLPAPGSALPLYIVTTAGSSVIGHEAVAPLGGIGSYHLKPANPNNTPAVSAGSITLVAEGATSAKATIPFSISGLTLDDTIGSIEIVQSFAGVNQWGNSHVLAWSPSVTSFTDERHGLAAGQGYDIAVNILGRNGKPLNASPLIIGTSPTISAAAIAIALNLDEVHDGTTYAKVKASELQGGSGGSGTVFRLNDGTYIRTAQHIADIISIGSGRGGLNVSPAGGVNGLIGGGNLAGGSVASSQVGANQAVSGSNLIPTTYSTNQVNTYQGLSSTQDWATSSGSGIATGSTLTNGNSYYWNTGSAGYTGAASPYDASYTLPASASATFVFQHNAYQSGSTGKPRIFFTGSSAGGASTTQASSVVSGTSTCSDSGSGTFDSQSGSFVAPYHFSSTNGSIITQQISTSQGPSGTYPIKIVLSSVTCPSGVGSSSLKIWLTNTSGATVTSGITVTGSGAVSGGVVSGISGNTTVTYSPSTADAAGTYTWNVQAIDSNPNDISSVPYNDSLQCSWSGSVYYWTTTGASGNTYVLASDGSTQRTSTTDSDVQMVSLASDTIAVKVFNGCSSQPLAFSIGMDVTGL